MLENFIINQNESHFAALSAINKNEKGIVFIVNEEQKLVGVLSDGDIRRYLLTDGKLEQSVFVSMNRDFVYLTNSTKLDSPVASKEGVNVIPIIDNNNYIVDIHLVQKQSFFPIAIPDLQGNELKYLNEAFLSTWISSRGLYIDTFETEFSNYIGSSFGVSTSNGTCALHLALLALGVGQGDEVILPDLTFAATVNAVFHANATPVIVDVESDSWTIMPEDIRAAITPKTKAIIVVHVYGQPCNMDEIMQIAQEYNLSVIEDCAEAHGATYKGKLVGSIGDIGCFSFFANKIITTGEGGMCVTNRPELDEKMRILRDHGMNPNKRYWHDVIGFNYRMTNLQAAIGLAQIRRIDKILNQRQLIEDSYRLHLKSSENVVFQQNLKNRNKVVWLAALLVTNKNRDKVLRELKDIGIEGRPFFYPLSDMKIYKPFARKCINSKAISKNGINLPVSQKIDESVLQKLKDCF